MTLYVTFDSQCPTITGSIEWRVGERENTEVIRKMARHATEVKADCDELEFIINHFKNIPRRKNALVVRWYGDLAKLIAGNLS